VRASRNLSNATIASATSFGALVLAKPRRLAGDFDRPQGRSGSSGLKAGANFRCTYDSGNSARGCRGPSAGSARAKPPSSDGLKKPPPRTSSPRQPSKKASGGQPNHPGKTLSAVANPHHIVDHFPTNCDNRADPLPPSTGGSYVARQVFDLPDPAPLVVTKHRAHRCRCTACGASRS
jgi:hypothetical protein